MPWLETVPMEQRERFIRDERLALYTMTELCDRYDISRKTGYKWLERFDAGGRQALGGRSRTPHPGAHPVSPGTAHLICDARRPQPTVGPDKLLDPLSAAVTGHALPAVSTAGASVGRKEPAQK